MIGDSPQAQRADRFPAQRLRRDRALTQHLRRDRGGLTILESVMALFVLGVALTTAFQLLSAASRQLRRLEDRDRATLAASNVLELLLRTNAESLKATRPDATSEWDWPDRPPMLASLPHARIVVETASVSLNAEANSSASANSSSSASENRDSKGGDSITTTNQEAVEQTAVEQTAVGMRIRVSVVGPGDRQSREVYSTLTGWRFTSETPP
jgi:Tfp pilus assembly protein PilV